MRNTVSRIVAGGMLRENTPIEDYQEEYGLWVKREDKACVKPGPPFSKTRGVYAKIKSRPEELIGVLDTYHSQAGHAVARACQILGKQCINYYPEFKYEPGLREPQLRAVELGATLKGLKAGRSAILFHQARKDCELLGGYMMPNALKLIESVEETAKEVPDLSYDQVIIPISSGTIAAGVIRGFWERNCNEMPRFIIHMGYSRSKEQVEAYIIDKVDMEDANLNVKAGEDLDQIHWEIVDEGYSYKDKARPGETPPWPCSEYYDLKAFRWWINNRRSGKTLFWNIG